MYKDPIRELIPKNGWLRKYYQYVKDTELCPRFAVFSALSMLGALINNRVSWTRVEGLFAPIYPNPWVILIGPAGRGHKTSALNLVTYFLQELPRAQRPRILSEKITPEALVTALTVPESKGAAHLQNRDATGLVLASELAVFLGKQQYNLGMITILTRLYDCPKEWSSDTIKRGLLPLRNVCLSVLAGTAPKWFTTMLPDEAFTGGPMSRFNLVILPKEYHIKIWMPDPPPPKLRTRIVDGLKTFVELEGKVVLTPAANKWATEWYEKTPTPSDEDELLDAYYSRKPEHIIRLAILLEICEHGKVTDVGLGSLQRGLALMELLEHQLEQFMELRSVSYRTEGANKVLEILSKERFRGRLSRKALLQKSFRYLPGKVSDFDEIINGLKERGQIKEETYKSGKKEDVWYTLTPSKILPVRREE